VAALARRAPAMWVGPPRPTTRHNPARTALKERDSGASRAVPGRANPWETAEEREIDMTARALVCVGVFGALGSPAVGDTGAPSPWATEVVSYMQGSGATPGYLDATTALGPPERFTGEGAYPSVVSPFSPPFGGDEIVSIGEGGRLTVRFATPITDDPANPFGVDLIVFGNNGFIDAAYPSGIAGPGGQTLDDDTMRVEVSADGSAWVTLGDFEEGFFPTVGYGDAGPYDGTPGSLPTDFRTPVDPSLTRADFASLDTSQIAALYGGSGGGTPIDIGGSGLGSVSYVRISNLLSGQTLEIDAFARVPAPSTAWVLASLGLAAPRRRR